MYRSIHQSIVAHKMNSIYDYDYGYMIGVFLHDAVASILSITFLAIIAYFVVFIILLTVSLWRLFAKAGRPGWAAIVPVYNQIVVLQIAGRPVWWVLPILFVPILQVWLSLVAAIDFAKSYGRSTMVGISVGFLPIVGLPMMGFSKNINYIGPVAAGLNTFVPAPDLAPATATVSPQPPQGV